MANIFKEKPKNINLMDVEVLLAQKGLVVSGPSIDELDRTAGRIKASNENAKLLYGETFDDKGNPIDSLKYYLFIDLFSKSLKEKYGIGIDPTVLIADLGMYRNFPDQIEDMKKLALKRVDFAEKVKKIYNCDYNVTLMSDLVKTSAFETTCANIKSSILADKELVSLIEKTVPEDRLEMERTRGYTYSIEELAVISNIDFKIGPPREELYDNLVNVIAPKLSYTELLGVYLYPTYPIGLQYNEYMSSSSIKQYGLTPYKVGSSNFSSKRIAIGVSTIDEIKANVAKTQISKSELKPNPIMDLMMIVNLAKQHLDEGLNNFNDIYEAYYKGRLGNSDLKAMALKELDEYILSRF